MPDRFETTETPINGLLVIHRKPAGDARGWFERLFCAQELSALLPGKAIVQINQSFTENKGTVRGMHFQHPPHAETKLVTCLEGEVFDVAVDLRRNSPTFLCWHGEVLSPENRKTCLIPDGFAHGFQTLEPESKLLYLQTAFYEPEAEGGVCHDDLRLGIDWPLSVTDLSPRDVAYPLIASDYRGIQT